MKRTISIGDITSDQKASFAQIKALDIKRGAETFKLSIDSIVVKEGWNYRTDFPLEETIELAEGILANKGTDFITVDILKNGDAVIIDGERRYGAYLYLRDQGHTDEWLSWMPAVVADRSMTTLDRKIRMGTANNHKAFSPFEEAAYFKDLVEVEGLKAAQVATRLGLNRVHVGNRLLLAEITTIEKEFIQDKLISVTEWVKLFKAMPDVVQRVNALCDATKGHAVVNDADDILAGYVIKKDFTAGHDNEPAAVEADAEQKDLSAVIADIDAGEYIPELPKRPADPFIQNHGGDDDTEPDRTGWTQVSEGVWIKDKEQPSELAQGIQNKIEARFLGAGLAALLTKTNVAPSNEPEPAIKKTRFTAKELIDDSVGSTLGDQDPETGTVTDTLKEVVTLLRSLERHFKGDSKMSDITFKVDKKIRYIQAIAKNSMMGNLTGGVI